MLTFNPKNRPSAKTCLANPLFNDIRIENLEDDAPFKVSSSIDKEGCVNYESSKILNGNMELLEYR
jgi:serine/threonine protein kinase